MAGCRRPSLSQRYDEADSLYRQDKPAAKERAAAGLAEAAAHHSREWTWKFRTLLASILINRNDARGALQVLAEGGPAPNDHAGAERESLSGYAEVLLGHYDAAGVKLEKARRLAAPLGDAALQDRIKLNLSALYALQEEFDQSEVELRQVIESASARGDLRMQAKAMLNLAYNDHRELRNEEAVEWLEKAIPLFQETGDRFNLAKATGNLGWAYLDLGALENALSYFSDAAAQSGKIGDSLGQITSLNGAAEILLKQRKYSASAERSKQALELARRSGNVAWEADSLDALAAGALELKNWDEARSYNEQSRALSRKLESREGLVNNQEVDARIAAGRKQYALAERLFRDVLASQDSQDPAVRLDAQSGLAKLYAAQGQPRKAEREFRAAIAYSETWRGRLKKDENKVTYLSSLIDLFREYVSFLVKHRQDRRALEVADSSRARVLAEKLIAEPKPSTAQDFQEMARRLRGVLLSYWLGPRQSYLWVVTGSQVATFILPGEETLAERVRKYQSFLEDGLGDPLVSQDANGAALWQTLIAPAQKMIPQGAEVILAPDGVLNSLNFETLPVPGERWHYWIEDATVRIAPSLSVLYANRTERREPPPSVLLIGDPVSPGGDFPGLPHAADELRRVRRHFPPGASKIYEGAIAQPAIYERAAPDKFRVIHFATHSLPNRLSPLDSALILSPKNGVYKLYARDIAEVPLRAELVTISACKSAGARTYSGEGQVGLAWAFLQAGASNVIAGLWDVDDTYTPGLMDSLYAGMQKGMDAAEALRRAKLALIHSQTVARKPYYWGPFLIFTGRDR
ncbi:MAG TPA: CHAT domain-containing tetratricopeptide repeat protein [Bryobacteraceae bacterium]|jgi:CHAT domain-containing protein|nr:CHAT domain-containing tetratricopeptide repeat protein [Bryobacteraceae bacterium]